MSKVDISTVPADQIQPATVIFGGTFDPVHYGHLRAASELRAILQVADFRLLPAGQPPHRDSTHVDGKHRLMMLRLALKAHSDLGVDDREIRRAGPSYMVDTLAELREQLDQRPLMLAVGQDAANGLDRWHQWQRLFDLAHIVVMTRPESERAYQGELADLIVSRSVCDSSLLCEKPAGLVLHVPVTQLAISSTDIREQIMHGRDARFLLPDSVLSYIQDKGLYSGPSA